MDLDQKRWSAFLPIVRDRAEKCQREQLRSGMTLETYTPKARFGRLILKKLRRPS